ncbi:uncharacterized protein DS421_14g458060 [Arachis hypogaea]|nr:uncharacterized protein DS421_14g458060 [Arachis hypogaea]
MAETMKGPKIKETPNVACDYINTYICNVTHTLFIFLNHHHSFLLLFYSNRTKEPKLCSPFINTSLL